MRRPPGPPQSPGRTLLQHGRRRQPQQVRSHRRGHPPRLRHRLNPSLRTSGSLSVSPPCSSQEVQMPELDPTSTDPAPSPGAAEDDSDEDLDAAYEALDE